MISITDNSWAIFSNFSAFRVTHEFVDFSTAEACYQWMKFRGNDPIRGMILSARSPIEVKNIACKYKMFRRPDWNDVKLDVMRTVLVAKTTQHPFIADLLRSIKHEEIAEYGPHPFWNLPGENQMGKLWMEVAKMGI